MAGAPLCDGLCPVRDAGVVSDECHFLRCHDHASHRHRLPRRTIGWRRSLSLCLCLRLDGLAPILYGLYDLHFHRLVCLLLCITKADGRRRLEEENEKRQSSPLAGSDLFDYRDCASFCHPLAGLLQPHRK